MRLVPGHWMVPRGRALYEVGMRIKATLQGMGASDDDPFRFSHWPDTDAFSKPGRRIYESFPKAWMRMIALEAHLGHATWVGNPRTGHFLLPGKKAWNPDATTRFAASMTIAKTVWNQELQVWN